MTRGFRRELRRARLRAWGREVVQWAVYTALLLAALFRAAEQVLLQH